ncbi:DUF4114 domain-containing protein [Paludisphaera mucosa]|uniref:SdrD B-like domain-containing protein n=1 Tax=Paludisphaera mucosa TaxID=3030827 RepID=A0ABT6FEP3_9BACT|nr:SdrD B-like domain-containing protein [Paludisphaera mucosa]MDG3005863.1 SdrD B-like domain-containing protein [Paludisphaera mucosa]
MTASINLDAKSAVLSIIGSAGADLARVEFGTKTISVQGVVQSVSDPTTINVTLQTDQAVSLRKSFAASSVKSVKFDGQGGVDLLSNLTTAASTWSTTNGGVVNTSLLVGSPGYKNTASVSQVGVFQVGATGQVGVDYLYRGAGYAGQLAIFSLEGMDAYTPGSAEYIKEAARRALSDGPQGHVVIKTQQEGAKYTASLPWEGSLNKGAYLGVHTVTMKPGDSFAAMLVPSGTVEQVAANPAAGGSIRPLFSVPAANPAPLDAQFLGQIGDLDGRGSLFAFEDQRLDGASDRDYNDMVFQVTGARGTATPVSQVINPSHNFIASTIFQELDAYAVRQEQNDSVSKVGSYAPGGFQVGASGAISVDYVRDWAATLGEVAVFSLQGMGNLVPGSAAYVKEAARRALSDSTLGHVVASDLFEAPQQGSNSTSATYQGQKNYAMTPGDSFAAFSIANGTVWQLYNGAIGAGDVRFSTKDVNTGGSVVAPTPGKAATWTLGLGASAVNLAGVTANPTDPSSLAPASVCTVVYLDLQDNGKIDPGDPSLPGVSVKLVGADFAGHAVQRFATSGPDGCAEFANVPPGIYSVTATDASGGTLVRGSQIGANGGLASAGGLSGIVLLPGDRAEGYAIGRVQPATLSGCVFADADRDRVHDPSEPGIAGVALQLIGVDDLGANVSLSTTSGADGTYTFAGLRPGAYSILKTQPAGYAGGRQSIGSFLGQAHPIGRNGQIGTDRFNGIQIGSGETGYNYNFAEWTGGATGDPSYAREIDLQGTSGSDVVTIVLGATSHRVTINGVTSTIDADVSTIVNFSGLGGDDLVTITGIPGSETLTVAPNVATLIAPRLRLEIEGVARIAFRGGVNDRAYLYDSRGNDVYKATPTLQQLDGPNYHVAVSGPDRVYCYAVNGGDDQAVLSDSAGDDDFKATPIDARLYGAGFYNYTRGFDHVVATSQGLGKDRAYLYDSAGNDTLTAGPGSAKLAGKGFDATASGFPRVDAYFNVGGKDGVVLTGSAGDDRFYASPAETELVGTGFDLQAHGVAAVVADGGPGGADKAYLTGTQSDDVLTASAASSRLTGPGLDATARAFSWVLASGGSCLGFDVANLADTAGNDTLDASPGSARLYGVGYTIRCEGFNKLVATASAGGVDQATLHDSPGDDTFVGSPMAGRFYGVGFDNSTIGFAKLVVDGSAGGNNVAILSDTTGDDLLTAAGDSVTLASATQSLNFKGFRTVTASSPLGRNRKRISAINFTLNVSGEWIPV